jgi:hypothetical protein
LVAKKSAFFLSIKNRTFVIFFDIVWAGGCITVKYRNRQRRVLKKIISAMFFQIAKEDKVDRLGGGFRKNWNEKKQTIL